jgi:predicted dehydrogenase
MEHPDEVSRRNFLAKSAGAAGALTLPNFAFAGGSDVIRVGMIGCGGRGSGAAVDNLTANPSAVIWSMADVFEDRLSSSRNYLKKELGQRFRVTDERAFTGFDAYKKLLATEVDVVILATPPGFRPIHLKAAIDAGKHVFMEKPVAVDAAGVRSVFASADTAASKRLSIVAGTQRRHDVAYREAMRRIHDGAIGDVAACYAYWNQGGLWMNERRSNWSDMEWQLRNWLYFTWLSGDHIVEQHVHNLDVCNWVMKGHPVRATSLAGRQVRTGPEYGHIFDHFATEYEYANGVKMLSMCRQIDGTANRVSEHIVGTKGSSDGNNSITGAKAWHFEGQRPNPYVEEHRHLYEAITSGKPINEGRQVAESTLTAIMGRMSAYTGQEVSWDAALNSQESLVPSVLSMGAVSVPAVAIPGTTKLI